MTEPNQPTDPAPTDPDARPEGGEIADTPSESEQSPEPEPTPNSEAARWRVRFREAEAQIDALAERIAGYQRTECEAAVSDLLDVPSDLWELGQADVCAFYNDDGTLNEGELRAAAGALVEMRPKLAKPAGPRWQDFGQYRSAPPMGGGGWDSVIRG